MSASCQSINSMFKVRPIRTCAKFEPVKESEAQIPSVELITELVKVELQELCFYVMVRVQYAPFGIADGNVHPRQNFPDTLFVIRNYGMVGGCHSVLFKSGITAEPVRGHIGVSVRPRLYLARDGGSLKIADDQHLYMPDSFGRTVLSGRRRSRPAAFGHDKDGSLALASTPSLQRTVLLVFRNFGGKEALVHFHIPMKGVKAVAPAHHIAQLMHHFPYGLVTLAAELALYLLCRYGTPGSRQQEHGRKPITHRKMAALHDRARTKLHLMFAIHASPGLMARIPAQAQTAALAAEQTVVFTETTQCSLAGGLVWVLTVKIKQGHIIYVFIVHTSRIKHKVFQYTPIGHLGGLNFANLGTCGHSLTVKRAVPAKIIRQIRDMDLSHDSSLEYARDLFMFSFYTRGMSFIDMAYLKKSNLQNGFLSYRRKKTNQQLVIKWEKPMQEIIDKYDTIGSSYLLPIILDAKTDERKQYKNAAQLVNSKLKKLGKQIGLPIPLTSYVARHAWASIARSKNIPLATISEAMGHDSESTTRIYLASLDTSVVDKANSIILNTL